MEYGLVLTYVEYSDVMGYMTVVALWVALPVVLLTLLMPDNKLRYVDVWV